MKNNNIIKAANILYNSRIDRKLIDKLPKICEPNNLEEAYKIQDELKKIYLTNKDNAIIGKKIGCTNKDAQKQVNIDQPFYGNLFSKYFSLSNCTLNSNNFTNPYMEAEFSFIINKDVNISEAPFNFEQISKLIEYVIGSVEIVDFRYNKNIKKLGIYNLIASNGASEYYIKGNVKKKINEINLFNHKIEVKINGELRSIGNSSKVMNNPINSLLWLINTLSSKNECILKNYIITTGTCIEAIKLIKGDNYTINYGSLGTIEFKYI